MRQKRAKNIAMLTGMARLGMTGQELAKAAGVSRSCITFTLNQRTDPKPETAAAIARALKTTPARLGWEVQP